MLEVRNLTKIYKTKGANETRALDNVSVKFPETGLVFLLGKSGSGKSTLLNVAGGLDSPTNGEIIIKGRSSKTFKGSDFDSYRNTFVGFIFQEYNILNEFTVEDNIALALQLQSKPKDKEKINQLLKDVDLANFARRKPNTLSGGQKQRIAIARALIKDPEIIMADEPTGALDSNTGKQVFDTLKKLSKSKLIIVVSHDREFAEIYGDRIIELKDGKIISDVTKSYTSATENGNVTYIDDSTFIIKKGRKLDKNDLNMINEFLEKSSEKEIVMSSNEKDIQKFKKESRIGDDLSKENFIDTDIDHLTVKEYSKEEQTLIRSKLPFKHATKIGLSNLKLKPFRLLMTILLSCIAFSLLGVVSTMTFYNKSEVEAQSLEAENMTFIPLSGAYTYRYQYNDDVSGLNYSYSKIDSKSLNELLKKYPTSIPYFSLSTAPNVGELEYSRSVEPRNRGTNTFGEFYDCSMYHFVDKTDNDNLKKRKLYGEYPKNEFEIAISSYTADSLIKCGLYKENNKDLYELREKSDLIKKPLSICDGIYTITGIFDVDDLISSKYDSIKRGEDTNYQIAYEFQELRMNSLLTTALVHDSFISKNQDVYSESFLADMITSYNSNFWSFVKDTERYEKYDLKGNKVTSIKENGVVVPLSDLCFYFYYKLVTETQENNVSVSFDDNNLFDKLHQCLRDGNMYDFDNDEIDFDNTVTVENRQKQIEAIIEIIKKYSSIDFKFDMISCSDGVTVAQDMEIVGFTDKNDSSQCYLNEKTYNLLKEYYMRESFEEHYITQYKPNGKDVYSGVFIDTTGFTIQDYKELLKLNKVETETSNCLIIRTPVMNNIEMVDMMITEFKTVFTWAGVIVGVFAILLLSNFISLSISNKKREIGILRAVGAKGSDVFKIFFSESLTIVAICDILSIIGTMVICYFINKEFVSTIGISLLVVGISSILLLIGIAIFVSLASTFIPVFKIARKKPVDSIRSL